MICSGVLLFRVISLPLLLPSNPQDGNIIIGLVCANKLKVNQIIADGKGARVPYSESRSRAGVALGKSSRRLPLAFIMIPAQG